MNPYTYQRRALRSARRSGLSVALGATLVGIKEVLGTNIGSIGLAMTLLTAGSVGSLAMYSQYELAAAEYVPMPQHVAMRSTGAVLGEQTSVTLTAAPLPSFNYEPVQIFSGRYLKLVATPLGYSADKKAWNYKISWHREAQLSGSLALNGKVVAKNISGDGAYETGYSLKPESDYRVIFYNDNLGKGNRVANRTLHVLEAEETGVRPVPQESFRVTAPKSGDKWEIGVKQAITWTSSSASTTQLAIRLLPAALQPMCAQDQDRQTASSSPEEGKRIMPPPCGQLKSYLLASSVGNSGSYQWTAGQDSSGAAIPAGSYRVSVERSCTAASLACTPLGGVSEGFFSLVPAKASSTPVQ